MSIPPPVARAAMPDIESAPSSPGAGNGPVAQSESAEKAGVPPVLSGACRVMFAFDVAMSIDLNAAERLIGAEAGAGRANIRVTKRAPASLGYQPMPLRMTLPAPQIDLGGWRNQPTCEALAFDFGGVSVAFEIPFSGTIDSLIPLGQRLYDNADFQTAAREAVERVCRLMAGAMNRAGFDAPVEDYVVYHASSHSAGGAESVANVLRRHRASVARLLRSENAPLSEQEIDEALSGVATYTLEDAAVIDWNASLVVDPDGGDVVSVLEYANMELLEMRALDDRLDRALDEAYSLAVRHEDRQLAGWRITGKAAGNRLRAVRQIARLQVDAALLFEGVNNAIKLVGDQYLARVYRLTAKRFHLPERDSAIERKLDTLNGIYGKLSDEAANQRMEILEWIIIVLIAVSIVLPFVTPLAK